MDPDADPDPVLDPSVLKTKKWREKITAEKILYFFSSKIAI
jgi:hypothetical protein